MTVKHMRIFLEVYRNENITKAAAILNMTQPAVTRTIKEIESYYGVCLFERMNQRLYKTESGTLLYAHAVHIVEAFDLMELDMKNRDIMGTIRIGSSITIGKYVMPQLVKQYQLKYTEMKAKVLISNGSILEEKLLDNELDLVLTEGCSKNPYFSTKLVGSDRLVLILPPGHPLNEKEQIRPFDVLDYPLLLREKGSTVRTLVDNYFTINNLALSPAWESTSTQAIVKAVSSGIGISFLPEQLVNNDVKKGAVIIKEVTGMDLNREYHLVWHKNKHLTKAMKNFISLCEYEQYGSRQKNDGTPLPDKI